MFDFFDLSFFNTKRHVRPSLVPYLPAKELPPPVKPSLFEAYDQSVFTSGHMPIGFQHVRAAPAAAAAGTGGAAAGGGQQRERESSQNQQQQQLLQQQQREESSNSSGGGGNEEQQPSNSRTLSAPKDAVQSSISPPALLSAPASERTTPSPLPTLVAQGGGSGVVGSASFAHLVVSPGASGGSSGTPNSATAAPSSAHAKLIPHPSGGFMLPASAERSKERSRTQATPKLLKPGSRKSKKLPNNNSTSGGSGEVSFSTLPSAGHLTTSASSASVSSLFNQVESADGSVVPAGASTGSGAGSGGIPVAPHFGSTSGPNVALQQHITQGNKIATAFQTRWGHLFGHLYATLDRQFTDRSAAVRCCLMQSDLTCLFSMLVSFSSLFCVCVFQIYTILSVPIGSLCASLLFSLSQLSTGRPLKSCGITIVNIITHWFLFKIKMIIITACLLF